MIQNKEWVYLEPEEAIRLATNLLSHATTVMERKKNHPAAFEYFFLHGYDVTGTKCEVVKFHIGMTELVN